MLRFIQRPETDPYYNIAAEEYLLKTAATDTFRIWQNDPSVIIGKHQNAAREINHDYVESRGLPVIRRITGGGTVFHGPGNINFSHIYTNRKENLIDFRYFTSPVLDFLKDMGLDAAFEGKNNITIDGLKVSGNSAHIYKSKVLHHGTLLFNADLDALELAISGNENLYKDKSVRSVRSKVANISQFLHEKISDKEFIHLFRDFIFNYYKDVYYDEVNEDEDRAISKLVEEKYKKDLWNFGYSPDYKYDESWVTVEGNFFISLEIKSGLIMASEIKGPSSYLLFLNYISDQLTGVMHEKKSISERLKNLTFADVNEKQVLNQIMQHLF